MPQITSDEEVIATTPLCGVYVKSVNLQVYLQPSLFYLSDLFSMFTTPLSAACFLAKSPLSPTLRLEGTWPDIAFRRYSTTQHIYSAKLYISCLESITFKEESNSRRGQCLPLSQDGAVDLIRGKIYKRSIQVSNHPQEQFIPDWIKIKKRILLARIQNHSS